MRCIVTAGGTFESLDLVRRLTNASTGQLGSSLAGHLATQGHGVSLFRSHSASAPMPPAPVRVEGFGSTSDLASRFLASATDDRIAIFHAAAVSDFAVGLIYRRVGEDGTGLRAVCSSKYATREGNLLVELRPTPKLLPGLREWYPGAMIVGWKFEVEGGRHEALEAGRRQLGEARSDLCVVNGPAHGAGYSILSASGEIECVDDAAGLLNALGRRLDPI